VWSIPCQVEVEGGLPTDRVVYPVSWGRGKVERLRVRAMRVQSWESHELCQ
jgi:hypothetical protein